MKRWLHALASLKLTVFLILLLSAVLAGGTIKESLEGAAAARGEHLVRGDRHRADLLAFALGDGRDRLLVRDGATFRRMDNPATGGPTATRGRSSLALGGHVEGLTPVLVEMGQQDQPLERRVELHLAVARAALELVGVL